MSSGLLKLAKTCYEICITVIRDLVLVLIHSVCGVFLYLFSVCGLRF